MPDTGRFMHDSDGFNLLQEAPRAVWYSGAGRLIFGGNRNDQRGFAIYVERLYFLHLMM